MIYPHTGILFCHKEEWGSDICYHMDKPWENYVSWNKPDTKGHILHNFIYMKHSEYANPQRQKTD